MEELIPFKTLTEDHTDLRGNTNCINSTTDTPMKEKHFIRTIRRSDVKIVDEQISENVFDKKKITATSEETVREIDKQWLDENLTSNECLIDALHESASLLKFVTDSDFSFIYITNTVTGYIIKAPENTEQQQICDSWKVGFGTTIAAFTAHTKRFIITDDVNGDNRFPQGLGHEDIKVQCAMTVPIMTPNNEVKAVMEFARNVGKNNYTSKELNTVLSTTAWIGNSIFYSGIYSLKMKLLSINEHLMRVIYKHSSNFESFEEPLAEMMVFGKRVIGASRSMFYLINSEYRKQTIADCYEEFGNVTARKTKTNVLISEANPAVRRASASKDIVNEKGTNTDFDVDKKHKLNTLCLPVIRDDNTIGIYELMDKKEGNCFTYEDELIIQNFGIYFVLLLDMYELKVKFEKKGHELNVNNEILLYHIKPCKHDEEELTQSITNFRIPDNFMTFLWYPLSNHLNSLAELSLVLFRDTLGDNFMKMNNMVKFVLTVKKCYRTVPYHNFEHAFTVTHTMANIIQRNRDLFSNVEKEGLMISTICHDLDHRGYTNSFIQLMDHPIAKLYQGSPMENHHFEMTQKIMECDMCIYMTPESLKILMKEIYDDIIFTDLSIYFHSRLQLVKSLKEKQFSWDEDKFRYLVKGILMTACDLSAQTKPYYLSKKPTYAVYKEFFNQGDIEMKMGLTPLPTMNRENMRSLPENQVQFLSVIIMPCYHLVSTLVPNTAELFQGCKNLRSEWRELVDSDYLSEDEFSPENDIKLMSFVNFE